MNGGNSLYPNWQGIMIAVGLAFSGYRISLRLWFYAPFGLVQCIFRKMILHYTMPGVITWIRLWLSTFRAFAEVLFSYIEALYLFFWEYLRTIVYGRGFVWHFLPADDKHERILSVNINKINRILCCVTFSCMSASIS